MANKIALGTVQFGIDYGINSSHGPIQPEEVKSIINYARSKNVDLLDTAPAYGNSEEVLGNVNVDDFKIVTKTRHFDNFEISSGDLGLIKKDFSCSLLDLRQSSIYGLLIHNANDLLKPGSKKLFDQLKEFKQEQKIYKIGVAVYDNYQLQSIIDNFDIDIVQLPFNILDKRLINSGMLNTLQNRGIEVHARSVFLQGLLLMSNQNRPSKFNRWSVLWKIWDDWLHDNKITALEATIRYVISIVEIKKVLVGVHTTEQLKEIIAASNGNLPEVPKELSIDDVNLLNPSNWAKL
jgi:aryl-alcohol dehydrogenase-like predicted oxidoreductase